MIYWPLHFAVLEVNLPRSSYYLLSVKPTLGEKDKHTRVLSQLTVIVNSPWPTEQVWQQKKRLIEFCSFKELHVPPSGQDCMLPFGMDVANGIHLEMALDSSVSFPIFHVLKPDWQVRSVLDLTLGGRLQQQPQQLISISAPLPTFNHQDFAHHHKDTASEVRIWPCNRPLCLQSEEWKS